MVERRRGDVVFVSSDVAVRARPFMSAYAAGKWGLEGHGAGDADGARGHRRARQHRAPRPDLERDGQPTGTTQDAADVLNQWVRFGLARHPHFLKPAAIADAITTVVSAPRGVHLNLVEVTPEAPVED